MNSSKRQPSTQVICEVCGTPFKVYAAHVRFSGATPKFCSRKCRYAPPKVEHDQLKQRVPLVGKHGEGKFVLVDPVDYDRVMEHHWTLCPNGYAYIKRYGEQRKILLHRFILLPSPTEYVDHISGDRLDCRRSNLRLCTRAENGYNRISGKIGKSSQFKGVVRRGERWEAKIMQFGVTYTLGYFSDEVDAAHAYDTAAREKFGKFARPNFPD